MKSPSFTIDLRAASRGYDRKTCWTQARAGAIPSATPGGTPTVVLTMQKLRLHGSDDYEGIHSLYSTDLGQTWSVPAAQAAFPRAVVEETPEGPIERVVCDFWPKWHAASGTLLGTGHTASYRGDGLTSTERRATPYSTYDPATHTWRPCHTLELPDLPQFGHTGAGCTQRIDLPGGEILLPLSLRRSEPLHLVTVIVRCSFDGETLRYLEHGNEITTDVPRGFGEASLAHFGGRFFVALRNDQRNYVATSDDGLHFGDAQPWCFDDGEELGSYNTQQHWVTHSDGLFLVYTRRGLNNDHVFRHRAPLLIAQVDPDRLCVLRATERPIVPERGARLGNFGITEVSPNETWVVEAEWMQNSGPWAAAMKQRVQEMGLTLPTDSLYHSRECEAFGSDNSVWTARLLWDRPNELFGRF